MVAMMKASYMHDNVAALLRLGDDVAGRVRVRARASIEAIEAAHRVDWLPLALDIALTDAIHAEVGDEGTRTHARLAARAALQSPLLRPFKVGAAALLRGSYHPLLRLVVRGWSVVFRDAGDPLYLDGCRLDASRLDGKHLDGGNPEAARRGVFSLERCPAELLRSAPWIVSTAGFFQGVLEEAGAHARVEPSRDVARGQVRYTLAW